MPYADKEKQAAYLREYYRANKEKYRDKSKELTRRQRDGVRSLKKRCQECGEAHPATLCFHHRDPSEKSFSLADGGNRGYIAKERLEAEIAKCDVLCHNCHAKLHWSERDTSPRGVLDA